MTDKINVRWDEAMAFTASIDGFEIKLDASTEVGGQNLGPRPKALLLVALAGCTGMDIASLARKMRIEIAAFDMDVEAQKSEQHPVVYTQTVLVYRFTADDSVADKLINIAAMSQEKYCGVAAMLGKISELGYRIELNGKTIFESPK